MLGWNGRGAFGPCGPAGSCSSDADLFRGPGVEDDVDVGVGDMLGVRVLVEAPLAPQRPHVPFLGVRLVRPCSCTKSKILYRTVVRSQFYEVWSFASGKQRGRVMQLYEAYSRNIII